MDNDNPAKKISIDNTDMTCSYCGKDKWIETDSKELLRDMSSSTMKYRIVDSFFICVRCNLEGLAICRDTAGIGSIIRFRSVSEKTKPSLEKVSNFNNGEYHYKGKTKREEISVWRMHTKG